MATRSRAVSASPPLELSIEDARLIALRAQGLTISKRAPRSVGEVLRRTGAVQLDTISVLARSHELVAYARLGATPRETVEDAYWGAPARAFEYHGHANCILPVELWPYLAFRRRAGLRQWPNVKGRAIDEVRARLKDGPITASDVGGARASSAGWWNWSDAKRALEMLYRLGEAVVTTRRGWKRVYDLAERALPPEVLAHAATDEECYRELVRQSARAMGIGTRRDIARYFQLTTRYAGNATDAVRLVDAAIADAGLQVVRVDGWAEPAIVAPEMLRAARGEQHRTTLLSPFDSLVWERERTERLFGFTFLLEAYKPKDQRIHGYFTMPLLTGGRLAGRVDPQRSGRTLIARSLSLEDPDAVDAMASALREAATWVGCDEVRVERAQPSRLKRELERALR
ncbi:MAG: crosslink repair DNA glycosylase YcaQ family protein [Dehalococcoidia bacterium]